MPAFSYTYPAAHVWTVLKFTSPRPLDDFYKFHVDGAAHPRFCFSPLWFLPRVVRNAPGLDGAREFIGFCFGGSRLYLLLAFSTS